jgi:hypothetical protein
MASTNRAVVGRVSGTGRRLQLASPTAAAVLGALALVALVAQVPLEQARTAQRSRAPAAFVTISEPRLGYLPSRHRCSQ